jgi:hypothetical protein
MMIEANHCGDERGISIFSTYSINGNSARAPSTAEDECFPVTTNQGFSIQAFPLK